LRVVSASQHLLIQRFNQGRFIAQHDVTYSRRRTPVALPGQQKPTSTAQGSAGSHKTAYCPGHVVAAQGFVSAFECTLGCQCDGQGLLNWLSWAGSVPAYQKVIEEHSCHRLAILVGGRFQAKDVVAVHKNLTSHSPALEFISTEYGA